MLFFFARLFKQSLGEHYLFYGNDRDKGKGNLINTATGMPENNILILFAIWFPVYWSAHYFVQYAQFSVHIIEN